MNNSNNSQMTYKYYYLKTYVYLLTSLLALALIVEWFTHPVTPTRKHELAISGLIYVLLYLLLRSTYCVATVSEVARASYFVLMTGVEIADISSIVLLSTWLSDDMRTLAIVSKSGRIVNMSEMAYGREALNDVVRRLVQLNPKIRFDNAAKQLLVGT